MRRREQINKEISKFLIAVLVGGALLLGDNIAEGGDMRLEGKSVLMIIAFRNFRDEEYLEPRGILEGEGAKITVASSSLGTAKGMLGAKAKTDIMLDQVNTADYDAILFVGGTGSSEYFYNPKAHSIAKEAVASGKILGAICVAPTTLANAGVLKGKKATCYSSSVSDLKRGGATYTRGEVEVAGNIVTADGPGSAKAFGEVVLNKLAQE